MSGDTRIVETIASNLLQVGISLDSEGGHIGVIEGLFELDHGFGNYDGKSDIGFSTPVECVVIDRLQIRISFEFDRGHIGEGVEGILRNDLDVLSDDAFSELVKEKKQTEEGREQLEGLFTGGIEGGLRDIPVVQPLTDAYIEQLGDFWSEITPEYLGKYLSALDGMDLFDF